MSGEKLIDEIDFNYTPIECVYLKGRWEITLLFIGGILTLPWDNGLMYDCPKSIYR